MAYVVNLGIVHQSSFRFLQGGEMNIYIYIYIYIYIFVVIKTDLSQQQPLKCII